MATPNADYPADIPPADVEPTGQNCVSPPEMADTGETKQSNDSAIIESGKSSNNNGSKIENKNGVEANREKKKRLEKEDKERSSDGYNEKSPEDLLKEIQMRKTHNLYCRNCTFNITETTKIVKKGEETFPYSNEGLVLWFVIVVSFKYPFIYIPWFYNNTTTEPTQSVANETPKKHIPDWLRFLLVVVLLLLSAIVLWVPPSPPTPPPPPPPHANGSLPAVIPDRRKSPGEVTEIDGNLNPHGPDAVVKDNKPIMPSPPPRGPDAVVEDNKPILPSPPRKKNKGGWIPSNRVLAVISLLLLAILAMLWPSISRTKIKEPENVVIKEDLPNATQNQNIGVQNSTSKPEDKKEEVIEDKQGVAASQNDDLSTPSNNKIGSGKKIVISLLLPKLAKLPEMLWKYIVVPELDIVKSIVYGGLLESITSFGVVSSAAASGTSTLNVMALGLANLFSGLFLIIYNLYGLITYQPRFEGPNSDHKPDVVATDPYKELLGKRDNYILHFFVVVVSFLFFGVIPPLFYGFSFKITGKGHYEAAAVVFAASLVCVISLSFAKAYAFGMDKLKTVAVYTGIAIGASAFSFVASQHVRDLFAKYGFHKLASDYLKG